ncbi:4Fe-4S single cluster domain-containing protein [Urbifossiella limnaea]|uniref:Pyruvate formate-lyase 1-activating enzyme n=1 Tax=Urbifossiella limnaea TaxID=2528023 RepID=A0A517XT38_9BACT|nr:4Fe-4S single cluster domain-containing protein [Urbifossiella limnaea]QDU20700.1 Pyruvate formate-lyase 1-activating enzyme [Urbifossiella limnaea]
MTRTTEQPTVRIAQVVACTEAEGPGKRFAVWFQGCPLRCPGCCNPEFLPFDGGDQRTVADVADEMERARDREGVEGITLLGGEPFSHPVGAVELADAARLLNLSVMVFSGYTLDQLRDRPDAAGLLDRTDILVDGPYLRDQPDTERRWIGSRNQGIHFLTNRYRFDDQWRKRNTLEIRVRGGEVTVNGFPAGAAAGLWKGWRRTPVAGAAS